LMLLPLTVSCFSKIQIGFTFLVPAHPGSPGKRAIKRVCVCACMRVCVCVSTATYLGYLIFILKLIYPSLPTESDVTDNLTSRFSEYLFTYNI